MRASASYSSQLADRGLGRQLFDAPNVMAVTLNGIAWLAHPRGLDWIVKAPLIITVVAAILSVAVIPSAVDAADVLPAIKGVVA